MILLLAQIFNQFLNHQQSHLKKTLRTTSEIHQYFQEYIDITSFDDDSNGEVGAFTDGFMVLRKMFGDVFDGDALTNKVLPDDATRNTDEIHDYIASLTTIDPIG